MRPTLLAAVVAIAFAGPASVTLAAAPWMQAVDYSDAQLQTYAAAVAQVRAAAPSDGTAPSAEQQIAMAGAVHASGMAADDFNALADAVASSRVLQARLAVLATPTPPAGSVSAGVTDEELDRFSAAMIGVLAGAPRDGSAPNEQQQAAMAAAVTATGMPLDRFNVIARAMASDARLRARLTLAEARNAS